MTRAAAAVLLVAALLAASCGGGGRTEPAKVRVYLLRDGVVAAAAREVPATRALARAALEQLLAGATDADRAAGLSTAVPKKTRLLDLTIDDGEATVNLSRPFADRAQALAQVVYTLTQFPTISSVRVELDGEPLTGRGTRRADFERLTPPLMVESPLPGETVASPLRIFGTANAYEATFRAEVRDASGAVLVVRTVMATTGSGQRGTFAAELPFETEPGPGRLVVWEDSAADGSRIHQVTIPLRLSS